MRHIIRLDENKLRLIVLNVLNEVIEGNSPDYVEYAGKRYEAMQDASFPILYYRGKWISKGETHRDIISLIKYGCEEWELEEYYSYDKLQMIRSNLNRLWSEGNEFKYPSRIYYAKGRICDDGIRYILVSWDELNKSQVNEICNTFKINPNEIVYVK